MIYDTLMRMAAFEHVRRLNEVCDHLTANELKPGFVFAEERIPLIHSQLSTRANPRPHRRRKRCIGQDHRLGHHHRPCARPGRLRQHEQDSQRVRQGRTGLAAGASRVTPPARRSRNSVAGATGGRAP